MRTCEVSNRIRSGTEGCSTTRSSFGKSLDLALLHQRGDQRQVLLRANQQIHIGFTFRLFVGEQETARAERLLPVDPQVVERHRHGNGVLVLQFAARHAAGQRVVHVRFLVCVWFLC